MNKPIADRFTWAVEVLDVRPSDVLLEVGCGHGVLADLVCAELTHGKLTAIDRSAKMIDAAAKRNAAHINSGKAVLHAATLAAADLPGERFDKIFSVNVSLFWSPPASELATVKDLLTPTGTLYIFHQPPVAIKNRQVEAAARKVLGIHGYTVDHVLHQDMAPAPAICVIARPRT